MTDVLLSMNKQERGMLYRWLAKVFARELNQDEVAWYRSQDGQDLLGELAAIQGMEKPVAQLNKSLNTADTTVEQTQFDLARAYNVLFNSGSGLRAIPPYESFYREGLLCQKPCREMEALLKEYGLSVVGTSEPSDHVAVELELMAHMTEDASPVGCEKQKAFVEKHLSWLPGFCADCQDRDTNGFYSASAQILNLLLCSEQVGLAEANSIHI